MYCQRSVMAINGIYEHWQNRKLKMRAILILILCQNVVCQNHCKEQVKNFWIIRPQKKYCSIILPLQFPYNAVLVPRQPLSDRELGKFYNPSLLSRKFLGMQNSKLQQNLINWAFSIVVVVNSPGMLKLYHRNEIQQYPNYKRLLEQEYQHVYVAKCQLKL